MTMSQVTRLLSSPAKAGFTSPWNSTTDHRIARPISLRDRSSRESDQWPSPGTAYSGTTVISSPQPLMQISNIGDPRATLVQPNMSHTSSKTWLSDESKERDRFLPIWNALRRTYQPKALVPWEFAEWLRHREAVTRAERKQLSRHLEKHDEKARLERLNVPPLQKAFGGKVFKGNRSAILAQETMWCQEWYVPERWGGTLWPGVQERRFEGEQRASSGYSRYPCLVRDWQHGNTSLHFECVKLLSWFDLDKVRTIPSLEDVYLPVDEISEDAIPELLNKDLLAALENDDSL